MTRGSVSTRMPASCCPPCKMACTMSAPSVEGVTMRLSISAVRALPRQGLLKVLLESCPSDCPLLPLIISTSLLAPCKHPPTQHKKDFTGSMLQLFMRVAERLRDADMALELHRESLKGGKSHARWFHPTALQVLAEAGRLEEAFGIAEVSQVEGFVLVGASQVEGKQLLRVVGQGFVEVYGGQRRKVPLLSQNIDVRGGVRAGERAHDDGAVALSTTKRGRLFHVFLSVETRFENLVCIWCF